MGIEPIDSDDRIQAVRKAGETVDSIQPQPTNVEAAAQLEMNTKETEKTQVQSASSGKGSIVNDMA